MIRMIAAIVIAAASLQAYPHEVRAAFADAAVYGKSARYLDLGIVPEKDRDEALLAMRFALPQLTRSVPINDPVRIPGTDLWRIDLDSQLWGWKVWVDAVAKRYPYGFVDARGVYCNYTNPLVINAAWFLNQAADAETKSDLYYDLVYAGASTPKNKGELFKFWGVRTNETRDINAGVIIDRNFSGVSRNTRLLERDPTARGEAWQTFDSRTGAFDKDPAETLAKTPKADAQEFIITTPKLDVESGQWSHAQIYFLTNGEGNRVDIADPIIVVDHSKLFGIPAIRTPGSCMVCHPGLNTYRENYLRRSIASGAELAAPKVFASTGETLENFLARFYLSDLNTRIEAANAGFVAFVESACGEGVLPGDAIASWQRTVERFDGSLTLEQAALETQSTEQELKLALGYYSELTKDKQLPFRQRVSALASGNPVDRASWESHVYRQSTEALWVWRHKK